MKRFGSVFIALCALALVSLSASQSTDLAGKWDVRMGEKATGGAPQSMNDKALLELRQTGNEVFGTFTPYAKDHALTPNRISEGKVEGNTVSFTARLGLDETLSIKFTLTLADGRLKGEGAVIDSTGGGKVNPLVIDATRSK